MRRITLALAFVSLAACSADSTVPYADAAADVGTPAKDAGKDATSNPDATTPQDAATVKDSSVVDVVIAPDAIALTCQSPVDCGGGSTPICCATLVTGAGSPPNCPISSLTSKCASSCTTAIQVTCSSSSTVRACAQNSDCPESNYGMCCTFSDGSNTATFCASAAYAQFAQSCK